MNNSNPIQPMSNILSQVVEDLSYGKVFIKDDYVTINELLAFRNGSLNILGSCPCIGKTSFSISLARNLTIKQNIPVGFITCGLNKGKLIIRRFIAQEARINYNSIAYWSMAQNKQFQRPGKFDCENQSWTQRYYKRDVYNTIHEI